MVAARDIPYEAEPASRFSGLTRLARRGIGIASALLAELLPKGLYARALIIIIAPIVLLEGVVAFTFMERHWQAVTRRLSEATVRDIAALIDLYKDYNKEDDYGRLIELARDRLRLSLQILPPGELPKEQPRPFFSLLDRELSKEIARQIKQPAWIDTIGKSNLVEIRIKLDKNVLRFIATRSQTYASNSHIFLVWMVGTSVVLLCVAILFLSAIRSSPSSGWPRPPMHSARDDLRRPTSPRVVRARSARPRRHSSRCAIALPSTWTSARQCWRA